MKNSFIAGAAVLMVANAVSKILGAVFKIPLTYIVHEEGMAVYNTSFSVYVMFLSFIVSGMPFAVQKLTAVAYARGDAPRAKRTVIIATVILAAAGIVGSTALWFGADFFALAMKEERAVWAIKALAPSVLFVALGTAVKSGFQGRSDMVPTAVSQVIEAAVKLAAGYAFAAWLADYGTRYAAAGAAAGVSVGELIATVMLMIWYAASSKGGGICKAGKREISAGLLSIAAPMLLMSVIGSFLSVCETSLLRMSLLRAGMSAEEARFVYGSYTGYALTILNLPSGLLATLGVSVIPLAAGAAERGDTLRIRSVTARGLSVAAAAGTLFSVLLFCFGKEALYILFKNTNSADMLRLAAPSVLFICIMQLGGAVLQSVGHIGRAFAASAAAAVIKIIFTVILVPIPGINIYGAVIGSDIGALAGAVINLVNISRYTGLKREYTGIIIIPAAAAAAVLVALGPVRMIFGALENIFFRTAAEGAAVALVFAAVFCIFGGMKNIR